MKLAYIRFESSEDFEKWQDEYPERQVFNITPMVSNIELNCNLNNESMFGTTNIAVFVTYKK